MDDLGTGIDATVRLVADPALDGVSGRYFDKTTEARADAQAYDADARAALRALSEELVGKTLGEPAAPPRERVLGRGGDLTSRAHHRR